MQFDRHNSTSTQTPPSYLINRERNSLLSSIIFQTFARGQSTLLNEKKAVDQLQKNQQSSNTKTSGSTENKQNDLASRKRKKSFIDLEQSHNSKIFKMINDGFSHTDQKSMIEKDDQTPICSSMVYIKSGENWKNRELVSLTSHKLKNLPIEHLQKIKIKKEQPLIGCKCFRFHAENLMGQMAIGKADIQKWFVNTIWMFLATKGHHLQLNTMWKQINDELEGEIYKKSEFLGKWEKRYARISMCNGFRSYKDIQSSPSLATKETPQIWTRFQSVILDDQEWIVFKFWYKVFKEEIAVPVLQAPRWANYLSMLIL